MNRLPDPTCHAYETDRQTLLNVYGPHELTPLPLGTIDEADAPFVRDAHLAMIQAGFRGRLDRDVHWMRSSQSTERLIFAEQGGSCYVAAQTPQISLEAAMNEGADK